MNDLQRHLRSPHTLILLCWVVLNLPLLLGFRVLPGDAVDEFYPMMHFNVQGIRHGMAPWWNPTIFSGYPQIADPQAMLFAPLMMSWMLLMDDPGMTWFVWGALLHVLVGGLGFAAFLRRLHVSAPASVIAAIVFMDGGVAASRIQYVPILIVYCLIPLALLAIHRFAEQPGWARGAVMGGIAGAMLVQPVQLTYLAGIVLLAYLAALVTRRFSAWSAGDCWRFVGGGLMALGILLAMALPQALFTYAFLTISNRPQLGLEAATELSIGARPLMTLLSPNAMHNLRGAYDGPGDRIETFFYVGAIPGLLLVLGSRAAWRVPLHRRYLASAGALALASIVYMAGSATPVYAWLHAHLPGVSLFRRPSDAAYLLNLAFALAIGIGASHVSSRRNVPWPVILAVASLWMALSSYAMQGAGKTWQASSILAPMAGVIAFFWIRRVKASPFPLVLFCVVTLADYRAFNVSGEFNHWRDTPARWRAEPAVAFMRSAAGSASDWLPYRIEAVGLGAIWKNGVSLVGLLATHGYGPLHWAPYGRWYGAYGDGYGPRPSVETNRDPGSPLNKLLGVGYLVHASDLSGQPGEPAFISDGAVVRRLPGALPRVQAPTSSVTYRHGTDPTAAEFGRVDFQKNVLLTPRSALDEERSRVASRRCLSGTHIVDVDQTHTAMSIHTAGRRDGWLAVSELDFPGWVARIDGNEVPFHRANGIFRALCVPAGEHHVAFEFHPWRMVYEVVKAPDAWR